MEVLERTTRAHTAGELLPHQSLLLLRAVSPREHTLHSPRKFGQRLAVPAISDAASAGEICRDDIHQKSG